MLNLRKPPRPQTRSASAAGVVALLAAGVLAAFGAAPAGAATFSNPAHITMPGHVMNELYSKATPYPSASRSAASRAP